MSSEITIIQDFIAAFNAKNIDKIMGVFASGAVYHNMPAAPVHGTEAIRRAIEFFVSPAEKIDWQILNIAQSGSTVLTERLDRFVMKGKTVELPVMGSFDLLDGKITAWRDYFDMSTWQRQTSG